MAIKPVDTLTASYDIDALLDTAAPAAAPDVEVEDSPEADALADDVEDTEIEVEASDDMESDDDDAEDSKVWDIPANGKIHKVDLKNEKEVKKLLSFGLGAPAAFSKAAKLHQENKRLVAELKEASTKSEKADLFDKLEAVKEDENELFRLITGGRSLDEVVAAKMAEKAEWETLDPVERTQREAAAREKALEQRIARMEQAAQNERAEAARLNEEASDKKTYSTVYPEFKSVFKALKIEDGIEAQETAADLWALGWDRVSRMAEKYKEDTGKELDLTPELARKAFAAVAKRWGYSVEAATKKEVAKVLDKKSKDATKRAGAAASRNYKKPSNNMDGLSPTKRFDKLFGR